MSGTFFFGQSTSSPLGRSSAPVATPDHLDLNNPAHFSAIGSDGSPDLSQPSKILSVNRARRVVAFRAACRKDTRKADDRRFPASLYTARVVRARTIKAYAGPPENRSATAPDIPTVDEAGVPGFYAQMWRGLWAPARTPKDIINKLDASVGEALANSAVRKRLADLGQEVPPRDEQTPRLLPSRRSKSVHASGLYASNQDATFEVINRNQQRGGLTR